MLETLLILACLSGNERSCLTSGEAYQRYSGLDKVIEQFGQKNPTLSFVVGSIGVAKEKKLYYSVYGPIYHEIDMSSGTKNVAWFRKEF